MLPEHPFVVNGRRDRQPEPGSRTAIWAEDHRNGWLRSPPCPLSRQVSSLSGKGLLLQFPCSAC
jgi:hypothetical protein